MQRRDEPTPNDDERVAEQQVRALGKGRGIAAASAAPTRQPEPAVKFSEFRNLREAARWGYPSVPEYLQDQADNNLPFQRGAPDGAAGSSTDTQAQHTWLMETAPCPKGELFNCLQCNKPSALINLRQCERCSAMLSKAVYYHRPSKCKNCYDEHAHYCESRALFGWRRPENKR